MSKKLSKEQLDKYLGEEAEEYYDFLEVYNKTPEGGFPRKIPSSVNKYFLSSPLKWSIKNHMTGYPFLLFLSLSFFCAYPFVITDIFAYTIPFVGYMVFVAFSILIVEMIRASNFSFIHVIRDNVNKGIKKRKPYSKRKLWIWRVIMSIPIIMFLDATFDLREYVRPFDQQSHDSFEKALRELERPNPFQVLATGYEAEEKDKKRGFFAVDEALYDYKMQKGLKHPLVRDDEREIVIDKTLGLMWQDNRLANSNTYEEKDVEKTCKKLRLGGYDDWRVPYYYELASIFDFNLRESGKSKVFKYSSVPSNAYWANKSIGREGRYVCYNSGCSHWNIDRINMLGPNSLRCVRSTKKFKPLKRFDFIEDVNRRVVLDKGTSLMWQNESYKVRYGRARVLHLHNEDTKLLSKEDALEYCADLDLGGYDDWYLSNVNQLIQLEMFSRDEYNGTILIYPPDANKDFHSSTSDFLSYGNRIGEYSDGFEFVRCVRDAKVWNWDDLK